MDRHAPTLRWQRTRRPLAVVALAGLLLTGLPTLAAAQEVATSSRSRILGDVTHERVTVSLSGGRTARGDLVRWDQGSNTVDLQPRLANARIAGLERFEPMQRREHNARQAVAGVNGGYFLNRPWGAPNGLHVHADRMSAAQTAYNDRNVRIPGRAALGIRGDGRLLTDRIDVQVALDFPTTAVRRVDELNRRPASGSDEGVLLYDDRYGTEVSVAAGRTILTVRGFSVRTSGRTVGEVTQVRRLTTPTAVTVPAGHALVVGDTDSPIGRMAVGGEIGATTTLVPDATRTGDWGALAGGAAGGQLLLRGGNRIPDAEHTGYSAFGDAHANSRRARTAAGRTAAGQNLLLTIDERSSAGVTVPELARVMQRLGASDAVNLDGGGSTSMAVAGRVVNTPSDPTRGHSTGLFLYADAPPDARDLGDACRNVRPAGFLDTVGTTHQAAIDCIVHWGLADGVSATRFDPGGTITRAQLAALTAALLDDVADRGDGPALPTTTSHPFDDVRGTFHERDIARLAAADILRGTSATRFSPNAPITREQTASLLRRALDHVDTGLLPAARDTFVDDNGSVHEQAIDRLAARGVVSGTGSLRFTPQGTSSRGAVAAIVARSLDLLVDEGVVGRP